jgi:hypothetical protein
MINKYKHGYPRTPIAHEHFRASIIEINNDARNFIDSYGVRKLIELFWEYRTDNIKFKVLTAILWGIATTNNNIDMMSEEFKTKKYMAKTNLYYISADMFKDHPNIMRIICDIHDLDFDEYLAEVLF